jgi:hypothetical protein
MAVNRAIQDISSQGLSFSLGSADYLEVLTTKSIDYASWNIRYDVRADAYQAYQNCNFSIYNEPIGDFER